MSDNSVLTAPALFGMQSGGAKLLAAGLVGALVVSVCANRNGVSSLPLLIAGLAVVSVGVGAMVSVRTDPMPRRLAVAVAATGPVGCLLSCLTITGPVGNANQLNALGAGVAICSFLGMRGRTVVGWWAFLMMVAVLGYWSFRTGLGVYGFVFSAPNVAVLGMATLFAVVVRPAATQIRELRAAAIASTEAMAAAEARDLEREQQRTDLRRVAWPTLTRIAEGESFTGEQIVDIRHIEAQLRDSVRARTLSIPAIADAVSAARSRGVDVAMFDDGGLDGRERIVLNTFYGQVSRHLAQMKSGSMTVRIHPPGRDVAGSIVMVHADGRSQRIDVDATGGVSGA